MRQELDMLRGAYNSAIDREQARRKAETEQFEKAIELTIHGKEVRVIAPNGTIFRALVTECNIDHEMADVSTGPVREYLPGPRTISITMSPVPG